MMNKLWLLALAVVALCSGKSFALVDHVYFDFEKIDSISMLDHALWLTGKVQTKADLQGESIPWTFTSSSEDIASGCLALSLAAKANPALRFYVVGSTDGFYYSCGVR
jgi:hypothetical protein